MILTMVLFIYLYLKHTKKVSECLKFSFSFKFLICGQTGGELISGLDVLFRTFPAYVGVAIRSHYYCLYC